jgi:hypothetical protein
MFWPVQETVKEAGFEPGTAASAVWCRPVANVADPDPSPVGFGHFSSDPDTGLNKRPNLNLFSTKNVINTVL